MSFAGPSKNVNFPEVLGALSLATDLANGNPMETALRTCAIALGLAKESGASKSELQEIYFSSFLRFIGCTSHAHEESNLFGGDDVALRRLYAVSDHTNLREIIPITLTKLAKGAGVLKRTKAVSNVLISSGRIMNQMAGFHCEAAVKLAEKLGMNSGVTETLGQIYERWDGKGFPGKLKKEKIRFSARLIHIAYTAEIMRQAISFDEICSIVKQRSGKQFDPFAVGIFIRRGGELISQIEKTSHIKNMETVFTGSRYPQIPFETIAGAFADFTDLKSVHGLGHSTSVAILAEEAAKCAGLNEPEAKIIRYAGYLHDIGSVSVPTGIWQKKTKLSFGDWEKIRLHSYYTERILSRSEVLSPLAEIAGGHHEKLDGTGYHRNSKAKQNSLSARILTVADIYSALGEDRSYRKAFPEMEIVRILEDETRSGKLDPDAVHAVLTAKGHINKRRKKSLPGNLSEREVEILRYVAKGYSNKSIGSELAISARTVQHHTIHIYNKLNVGTRAGAALFAMENDLL